MLMGARARRGVRTTRLGAVASPSASASLTSGGKSCELWWSSPSNDSSAMWMTYSRYALILREVSFCRPPRRPQLKPTIGGNDDRNVKVLNGARLVLPGSTPLPTQAIGRGTTAPVISL